MENLTSSELFDLAFQYHPHNSSFAIPGLYDLKPEDATWVLVATLIFFTMQTGLALIEAGVIDKKNQVNVMMKNIVDMCAGGISFWIFGFGLMFGRGEWSTPFFGSGDFFVNAKPTDPLSAQIFTLYFFQMAFATTSTTLVSGAVAERFRFTSYIIFSFMSTFVYAVGAGWVWGEHGFLKNIGVLDFSGAGPIHIIGGAAGFVAAWYIGPRIGRYNRGTEPLPMGDPMSVCVGLFILWWGWIGFNTGSSYGITGGKWEFAARAGAGTTLATMAAGMTSILFSLVKHKGKVDVYEVVSGILSALVAINSGCYMFSMYSSFLTGSIAAILCLIAGPIVEKMRVDDAVGVTAVHLVNGIWGQISVGLFADPLVGPKGLFIGGNPFQLIVQTISVTCLTIWAASVTLLILWFVDHISPIRLSPENELKGCDLTEHYLGEGYGSEVSQNKLSTLDKIISISTPIARRFSGTIDDRNRDLDSFGRRKPFHSNQAFECNERI